MSGRAGGPTGARAVLRYLLRGTWRAAITLAGFALVVLGLAGLVLPVMPGWVLIIAGFAVLAREYTWAHSALERARKQAARGGVKLRGLTNRLRQSTVVDLSDDEFLDLSDRALDHADAPSRRYQPSDQA